MTADRLARAVDAQLRGALADAEHDYRALIAADGPQALACANLAVICAGTGRLDEAITLLQTATALEPDNADHLRNLGVLLGKQGQREAAVAALQGALALRPDDAASHQALGNLAREAGNLTAAIDHYRCGLQHQPGVALHYNLALVLEARGELAAAATELDAALILSPSHAPSWNLLGNLRRRQGRVHDAVQAYETAIRHAPQHPDARINLANLFQEQGEIEAAHALFAELHAIDPEQPRAAFECARHALESVDWDQADDDLATLHVLLSGDALSVSPFHALVLFDEPALHQACARRHAAALATARQVERPSPQPASDGRIRVGWLSSDLHEHPTTRLIVAMFEHFDRRRFELHLFSTGPDDGSALRQRLITAVEHFHDLRDLDTASLATRIRTLNIELLVDLKGHTRDTPLAVLALRPAPVQLHWLGYPGTLGMAAIDYQMVDPMLVPDAERAHWDEALIRLPVCYQLNDPGRELPTTLPPRSEHGLPDAAFVYASFNNPQKLLPETFACWMRILAAVPDSVLWLWHDDAIARERLRHQAEQHGVSGQRLVFAHRVAPQAHLARLGLADLFLDSFPYNAHTTASDALWAGLPLLSRRGQSMASRVGASLLHAAGLDALITDSVHDYEHRAIALATSHRTELQQLRARLGRGNTQLPLFDVARSTRAIEAALACAHQRWREALPPADLSPDLIEAAMETPMTADTSAGFTSRIAYTACPLCDTPAPQTPIVTADCSRHALYQSPLDPQMRWLQCPACLHMYTDGHYTDAALELIFGQVQDNQRVGHDLENQRAISARMIDRVLPWAHAGAWLDVGFGNGALLLTAAEYGFEPVGLDLRADNVDTIRQLGVQAHCTRMEDWPQPGRFSVISLCDVLEHMPWPAQALRTAHAMLRPGGVLLLSLPNADSVLWTLLSLNRANPYWSELEHYHNFGRARLERLLADCSFDVVRYAVSERYRVGMELVALRLD